MLSSWFARVRPGNKSESQPLLGGGLHREVASQWEKYLELLRERGELQFLKASFEISSTAYYTLLQSQQKWLEYYATYLNTIKKAPESADQTIFLEHQTYFQRLQAHYQKGFVAYNPADPSGKIQPFIANLFPAFSEQERDYGIVDVMSPGRSQALLRDYRDKQTALKDEIAQLKRDVPSPSECWNKLAEAERKLSTTCTKIAAILQHWELPGSAPGIIGAMAMERDAGKTQAMVKN